MGKEREEQKGTEIRVAKLFASVCHNAIRKGRCHAARRSLSGGGQIELGGRRRASSESQLQMLSMSRPGPTVPPFQD